MKNSLNFGGVVFIYMSPEIEICKIPINRGFVGSNESFEDGGTLSWDNE